MLDTYDSGMCDISTANCISQVVARQLPFDRGIRLIRHNENRADLEIRGHRIPLSTELLKWLVAAETGRQVDPIEVVCNVPEAGPDTTTIVRMAKAPSGLPSKKSAVPRKPARTRPIAPAPRPQSEMEATLRGIATPAKLIHANASCPSGQKMRRRPEVEEYLQGY